jgi:Lrp/AsnC family leucine-responsive transcriptional regulator
MGAPCEAIGEQVGLSASAVLRRVKRLEDSGVIERTVALLRPEAVGLGLVAYVNVRLEKHQTAPSATPWTCSAPACRPGPRWWSAPR